MHYIKSSAVDSLSQDTASELIDYLTPKLRKMAFDSGWPARIISVLEIRADDTGGLYIDWPDNVDNEVNDLEYGNLNSLPNSVIRAFGYRVHRLIDEYSGLKVMDSLTKLLLEGVL